MPSGIKIPAAPDFKPIDFKNVDQRTFAAHVRSITNVYKDADPSTVRAGKKWYPEAKQLARQMSGDRTAQRGAGVIAALSPSQKWSRNLEQAHEMFAHPLRGIDAADLQLASKRASDANQAVQAAERVHGKGQAPQHLYDAANQARDDHMGVRARLFNADEGRYQLNSQSSHAILQAHRIHQGANPEDLLPMRLKTGNFFRNLNNPEDAHAVTIDTHAHDIATGTKMPWKTNRGLEALGRYGHFADAYRSAANVLNVRQTHQVQATTWAHWQTMHGGDY